MAELHNTTSWPADYEVKIFGGGNQFPSHALSKYNNIQMGLNLLKQHGFTIKAEHLGGNGHRNLVFDVWSGLVWLKHVTRV